MMLQELENSIKELVKSLRENGYRSSSSHYLLFSVIIYLIIWNKMNGRYSDNRDAVDAYMRYSLYQRYMNSIPEPDEGAIADRLMGVIDRILGGAPSIMNNQNALYHIR